LPRKLLSFGDDAVSQLVGIRLALATLLAFWPAAELGVGACGFGFCSAGSTPKLSSQFAVVGRPFVTALRTLHRPQNTTQTACDA
jgi:hypothetical protein